MSGKRYKTYVEMKIITKIKKNENNKLVSNVKKSLFLSKIFLIRVL